MSERKKFRVGNAVVQVCHMSAPLTEHVVKIASDALSEGMTEMEVAKIIRSKLTAAYPADIYQVFVGRNFGCFVTYETGKYVYFYINQTAFCVFAV